MQIMNSEDIILSKAFELFTKHGIRAISLNDIQRQTPLTRKDFSDIFTQKKPIVEKCVLRVIDGLHRELEGLDDRSQPLRSIIDIYYHSLAYSSEISIGFFFDLRKYHKDLYAYVVELGDHIVFKKVFPLLSEAKEKDIIASDINIVLECSLHRMMLEKFLVDFKTLINNYSFEIMFEQIFVRHISCLKTSVQEFLIQKD